MGVEGDLRKFMKFICKKYDDDKTFRAHGHYPGVLISQSKIYFGDGAAQLSAMDVLLRNDLIEPFASKGVKHITSSTKIIPSMHGLKERKQGWLKIVTAVSEGITRGIIKGTKG